MYLWYIPVLEPQILVETQQPSHQPGGVPAVVPDQKREGAMNEVELGFVHRLQLRSPVRVGDDDMTAIGEVVRSGPKNCVPCLGEILKGEEEHEPT